MEGHHGGQYVATLLHHVHLTRRHRATVAGALDDDVDGLVGVASLREVRVQGMRQLALDGGGGPVHGLGKELTTEDAAEAAGLVECPKPVGAQRLQTQCVFEIVERAEGGLLQRGAGIPKRTVRRRPGVRLGRPPSPDSASL